MQLTHCSQLNVTLYTSNPAFPPGYHHPARTVDTFEFDYILTSDNGMFLTDGMRVPLSPGMFFVRTPGTSVQSFYHYTSWYMTFEAEKAFSFPRTFYMMSPELCTPIFRDLYDLHIQRPDDYEYLADCRINQLLFLLYRKETQTADTEKNVSAIAQVHETMKNSWHKNYPLDYYVKLSGYSKSRFCHLFQEMYKISPISYIHQLRMQHLCYQLIETDKPIKELMIAHGYTDDTGFFRSFKAYTGDTPASYRKKHRIE